MLQYTFAFFQKTPLTITALPTNIGITKIKLYEEKDTSEEKTSVVDGLQYRTNKKAEWQTYKVHQTIDLQPGEYVQFQNTKSELSVSAKNHIMVLPSNYVSCSGQIESLINYSKVCPDYCFYKLFYNGNENLENFITTAPKFTAHTVGNFSYAKMFDHCTNLKQTPDLPATTIGNSAYWSMFSNCTSLTNTMSKLPAKRVGESCYQEMFQNCTSLSKTFSKISLDFAPLKSFRNMFYGTAITKTPKLLVSKMR
jgi:hypothetical protein